MYISININIYIYKYKYLEGMNTLPKRPGVHVVSSEDLDVPQASTAESSKSNKFLSREVIQRLAGWHVGTSIAWTSFRQIGIQ